MEEFVQFLVKPLVKHPDRVEVELFEDEPPELHLWVDPDDRGAVIGRRGKTIRALRDLVRAWGDRHGKHADLVLIEDEDDDSVDSADSLDSADSSEDSSDSVEAKSDESE